MTTVRKSATEAGMLDFPIDSASFQTVAQAKVVASPGWWRIHKYKPIPGPRIVFARWLAADNSSAIYSLNPADHLDCVNLSGPQAQDTFPSINPHTGLIVFARGFPAGGYGTKLYTMNTDGTGAVALPVTNPPPGWIGDWCPRWSPNAQRIAFVRFSNEGQQIWIVNADGTGAQPVMNYNDPSSANVSDNWPTWSNDSKWLAFARESGGTAPIVKVELTQLPAPMVTYVTLPGEGFDTFPAWQPVPPGGNALIAFTRNDGEQSAIMTIVATQPSNLQKVANVSKPDYEHGVIDGQPCWSPAGDQIAFARTPHLIRDIWQMDADGANQVNISNGPGAHMDTLPDWRKYA